MNKEKKVSSKIKKTKYPEYLGDWLKQKHNIHAIGFFTFTDYNGVRITFYTWEESSYMLYRKMRDLMNKFYDADKPFHELEYDPDQIFEEVCMGDVYDLDEMHLMKLYDDLKPHKFNKLIMLSVDRYQSQEDNSIVLTTALLWNQDPNAITINGMLPAKPDVIEDKLQELKEAEQTEDFLRCIQLRNQLKKLRKQQEDNSKI